MRRFLIVCALCAAAMALGPISASAQSAARPEVTLHPGDVLRITVWPDSTLSGDFPVEETGYTYLPGLGALLVSGRAIDGLRSELREEYARFMSAPVVTVTPLFKVSVLGAVARPGLYTVDPTVTLFDAISMAGGLTDRAASDDVRLMRGQTVTRLDAEAALTTGGDALGLALMSGDRIVVPNRRGISFASVLGVIQLAVVIVSLAVN